jgi:hypothetical protein
VEELSARRSAQMIAEVEAVALGLFGERRVCRPDARALDIVAAQSTVGG